MNKSGLKWLDAISVPIRVSRRGLVGSNTLAAQEEFFPAYTPPEKSPEFGTNSGRLG